MSSFYTSVNLYGNSILYRGYDENGNRVKEKIKFEPTLYLAKNHETGLESIDGVSVEPRSFHSISEAKEFCDMYSDVKNMRIYGNQNYIAQFILDQFPGNIQFDYNKINISSIDIEVKVDGNGFPEPEKASQEVTAITVHNSKDNTFYIWGLKDYDVNKSKLIDTYNVIYKKCDSEVNLLLDFLTFWNDPQTSPDVVTGWNIRIFDIPYLVNRITNVIGSSSSNRLSPWSIVKKRNIKIKDKYLDAYDLIGIQQLDYLDIFKKFTQNTLGVQESYSLNHISHVVLNMEKISYEEYLSLDDLYEKDHQKFIDYNIHDSYLVLKLEEKLGIISLVMTMAYRAGVNYSDTMGTTAIWDSIIYRDLAKKNIVIPPSSSKARTTFVGGYVKDPMVGLHEWVASFDLNSLYPSIISQWNISPETLLPETIPMDIESALHKPIPFVDSSACIAVNGLLFSKNQEGIIPSIVKKYYSDRKTIKKKMLETKQKLEQIDKNDHEMITKLEKEISRYDNEQTAIKILLNSVFGALGNPHFRYTNMKIAEAITTTGQMIIRWAENTINNKLNSVLNNEKDRVCAIDTDSTYIVLSELVDQFKPKDPVNFIDGVCKDIIEPEIQKSYDDLFEKFQCYEKKLEMSREVIADRGIWTAKKRYILNVYDNEGVRYREPQLKIMGIEAIKSSTPEVCRDALKELFKVIMTGSEELTQQAISKFKDYFVTLPPESVAFPRGVSDIDKWSDKKTIYKKATPIHVRGSLLYNNAIKKSGLNNRLPYINNGDKIKFSYLKLPNPLNENVVSFKDYLPEELKLNKFIDYDSQFEKSFLAPIKPIFKAIGWSTDNTQTLESFFE